MTVALVVRCVIYLVVGLVAGVDFQGGRERRRRRAHRSRSDRAGVRLPRRVRRPAHGSGEAVQGFFPLFFVLLFLSSMTPPARPDRAGLVPRDRDRQPGLLPDRGPALADHHRLGRQALGLGFLVAAVIALVGIYGASRGAADAAGADMRRFADVAGIVAWRSMHNWFSPTRRSAAVDHLPAVLLRPFAGGLSNVGNVPGSTSRPATRRSSSCSCCCRRRPSAACSPGSRSPRTSRTASRAG